jgi:hypothetical protein
LKSTAISSATGGRYAYAYASAADRPRQAMASGTPGEIVDILAGARATIEQRSNEHGPESVAVADLVTQQPGNLGRA